MLRALAKPFAVSFFAIRRCFFRHFNRFRWRVAKVSRIGRTARATLPNSHLLSDDIVHLARFRA